MKIFGITGWSGSGKTELILRLITHFKNQQIKTSIVKHAHHSFQIDKPNKDSFRYREHGSTEALVASSQRWALIHENQNQQEPKLKELISKMQKTDLIIVEGFKNEPTPKIEVWRKNLKTTPIAITNQNLNILAIATQDDVQYPTLPLNNTETIAEFILKNAINAENLT